MMSRILLLEPDVKLADIYSGCLRYCEYEVTHTTTAQDAILRADENTPDLVILELQLVAHSGIEFLYEFRSYADWQQIPVIIVSHVPPGEFAASSKLLHRRLGVRAYLYKPQTSLRRLMAAVGHELAHKAEAKD